MSRNGILIDYEYCSNCHTCEVICKMEQNIPEGKWGIKVYEVGPWLTSRCVRLAAHVHAGSHGPVRPMCVPDGKRQAAGLRSQLLHRRHAVRAGRGTCAGAREEAASGSVRAALSQSACKTRKPRKGSQWPSKRKSKAFITHGSFWRAAVSCSPRSMALINSIIGAYMVPVTTALECARGDFTLMLTTQAISIVVSMPIWGNIFQNKKININLALTIGALTMIACPLICSFATSLPVFYVAGFIGGVGIAACFTMATPAAHRQLVREAAPWQDDRHRLLLRRRVHHFLVASCSPSSLPILVTRRPISSMRSSWRSSSFPGRCSSSSATPRTRASNRSVSKKTPQTRRRALRRLACPRRRP